MDAFSNWKCQYRCRVGRLPPPFWWRPILRWRRDLARTLIFCVSSIYGHTCFSMPVHAEWSKLGGCGSQYNWYLASSWHIDGTVFLRDSNAALLQYCRDNNIFTFLSNYIHWAVCTCLCVPVICVVAIAHNATSVFVRGCSMLKYPGALDVSHIKFQVI